jgi:translocation and assembly module TamA
VVLLCGAGMLFASGLRDQSSHAADPVLYGVEITETGTAAVDAALRDSATLLTLKDAPVGGFALVARARNDIERMRTVLNSYGHYRARVAASIEGLPLDDPALPARLDALPAAQEAHVVLRPEPGPVFHLRRIALRGDAPADARARMKLDEGAPAIAADVLAAGSRLQGSLRDDGFALARVDVPVVSLDDPAEALDLVYPVSTGPRVDLGRISFEGLEGVHEGYALRRLGLTPGERFSPARLAAARQNLADSPAFASVRVDPGETLDPDGRLPVRVVVSERARRAVTLGALYSTDQGASLNASWTHRNLFGNAEQLVLSAAITQLGGSATTGLGYNVGATLKIPDWLLPDQTLSFSATALREYLRAYDRDGVIVGTAVARKLTPDLTVSVGLTAIQEKVAQEGVSRDYTLLQLPIGATFDSTGSLLDPVHGYRAAVTITPTISLGGARESQFVIAQLSGSTYLDVGATPGRSIVALRALLGTTQGASVFDLPPDQRFYAGGSSTVRGFRFQSIGPQFISGRPTGGSTIGAGSVEMRQRFGESWGAVAFVDAGQVSTNSLPFSGGAKIGAGVGARYYTGIGPIRLDAAIPVNKTGKGDAFELYIGLGQAF